MRVGLLGATGFTGRLTAQVLARRGVEAVLAARDPARLDPLPAGARAARVDVTDPAGLRAFLGEVDAVVTTVGPFNSLGRAAADAAAATRTPYVDSTGETTFIRWLLDAHAGSGVPMVPACGVDYVPGDLAVALAADEVGGPAAVVEATVGYELTGAAASRGTARSGLGELTRQRFTPHRMVVPFPDRDRSAVQVPWGEEVLVPRRSPGAVVRTGFVAPAPVAAALGAVAPIMPATQPLLRLAAPLLARLVERLPEGPAEAARELARVRVLASVRGDGGRVARVLVEGRDLYGLTAELLVACALRLPDAPPGARTTAQAFPAGPTLDDAAPLLTWRRLP